MTLATKLILIAALVLSIFIPFGYYLLGEKNKGYLLYKDTNDSSR